jgi:hypothetical protein
MDDGRGVILVAGELQHYLDAFVKGIPGEEASDEQYAAFFETPLVRQ